MIYLKSILTGTSKENTKVNFSSWTHVYLHKLPVFPHPTVTNKRSLSGAPGWLRRSSVQLDFSSGHELTVMGSSPGWGSVLSVEPAWDSLSLCPSLPSCSLALSNK